MWLLGIVSGWTSQRVVHPHGLIYHLSNQTLPLETVVFSLSENTRAQRRGYHQLPTLPTVPGLFLSPQAAPGCLPQLLIPFIPLGSREPSLAVRCGTSSNHACPMVLFQEQTQRWVVVPTFRHTDTSVPRVPWPHTTSSLSPG
jgi:hypothetical protein